MSIFGPGIANEILLDSKGRLLISSGAAVDPSKFISTYLLDDASNDMGVDGSGTAVTFSYTPPAGNNFELSRLLIYMEAGGAFDSIKFMNLTALTNGVDIIVNGNTLTNWKDNIDILTDMFDLSSAGAVFGKATRTMSGRWTFTKGMGEETLLVEDGNSVEAVIQDDLSAANIIYRMKVQGELIAL